MATRRKGKDDGLELSPKHGVNPALDKCFWCGGSKGVALLGRVRKPDNDDAEAPKQVLVDLEPCDECRRKFETGVLLVETTPDGSAFDSGQQYAFKTTDGRTVWPTGRWAVLRPEAVAGGKPGGKVLCGPETMDKVLSAIDDAAEKAERPEEAGK